MITFLRKNVLPKKKSMTTVKPIKRVNEKCFRKKLGRYKNNLVPNFLNLKLPDRVKNSL